MHYLHTMVRVSNLDISLEFYCQKLGLIKIKRTEHETGRYTLVFLAAPSDIAQVNATQGPLLELTYNWDDVFYEEGRNFGHLAFGVDNIYETCQRLKEMGVIINRPPRDGYMAFIRSPDNISIELLQKGLPLPKQEPWASEPNIGRW